MKIVKKTSLRRIKYMPLIVRGRYDSAQTTDDNTRHWINADNLSADAAANPAIRNILRSRARYELANNSYGTGIVRTFANDVVGIGPKMQLPVSVKGDREFIQRRFRRWCRNTKLVRKLRTMVRALVRDGEAFAVLVTNGGLKDEVKLDLKLIEADRVTTPDAVLYLGKPNAIDGIVFDEWGNPLEYHILKRHPGSDRWGPAGLNDYDKVPAEFVIHLFDMDRPEQNRGITPLVSSLPLFAQLRQYRLAVLGAARAAANIAMFMKTTMPPDQAAAEVEPMATMEIEPNLAVFVPEGWEPFQIKSEQPTTTVGDFSKDVVGEAARPLHMPKNVALCDSSSYNYASGRMDHQTYYKGIDVERDSLEDEVLDRVARAWFEEARFIYPQARSVALVLDDIELIWMWGGQEHVDPEKEANAQEIRLRIGVTNRALECAKEGNNWEEVLDQAALEKPKLDKAGVAPSPPKATPISPRQSGEGGDKVQAGDDDDDDDGDGHRLVMRRERF